MVLPRALVSTKILPFGRSNLISECQNYSKSEAGSLSYCSPSPLVSGGHSLAIKRALAPLKETSFSKVLAFACWYLLVQQYSGRNLIFPSDRLRTISVIASEILYIAMGFTYMSGLWKEDLNRGLIWRLVEEGEEDPPRRIVAERKKTGAST